MDLEQKLEGPWAWPFAIVMCLIIVLVMWGAKQANRMPTPPPAVSSDIAATQGEAPLPARGTVSGVPSGSSPESAGVGTAGSAGSAVHAGSANAGPGSTPAPSTGTPNPAAGSQ
jgi:hypothetical protein